MARCCWNRNGVVSFGAFFTVVGVLVIAAGHLWLSWASVGERAVRLDGKGEQFRSSPIEFKIFHILRVRAQSLSDGEREAIAVSQDLYDTKRVAVSFVVMGAVKTSLSIILLVAGLMEVERVLQWFVFGNALLLGAVALQLLAVEVVLLQARPGMVFAMPGTLTTGQAATVLPIVALFCFGLEVASLLCVRRFYCDLMSQIHPPCELPMSSPV